MKRFLVLIMILSIVIVSTGCSSRVTATTLGLPINGNMILKDTFNKKVEKTKIEISTYTIENESLETFLEGYEKELIDEGWTTRNNLKPHGLVAEKDNNTVTFIVYEESDQLYLDIIPTPKAKK